VRAFGIEAIYLCEKFEKTYYVKNDLAKYLDGIEFTNTDTRTVDGKKPPKAQRTQRFSV